MATKNGYVNGEIVKGRREVTLLPDPEGRRDGYVAQWWQTIEDKGLQLVTQYRQPGVPSSDVCTTQEVYLAGSPDGAVGRWALAGVPTKIDLESVNGYDPSVADDLGLALAQESDALVDLS